LSIGQDRIEITSENMSSWLIHSPIIQKFTHRGGGWVTSGLDEKLKLQPGDVVWIGKQRDRPEVKAFLYSFMAGRSHGRMLGGIDGTWSAETSSG
jgi:hypothetical protein